MKKILSLIRPHNQICIKIYILILKNNSNNNNNNSNQKQNKKSEKEKEKKNKKKGISVENLTEYIGNVSEFAQCTFNLPDRIVNFSWLLHEFNVVYVQRQKFVLIILQQHTKYILLKTILKENC